MRVRSIKNILAYNYAAIILLPFLMMILVSVAVTFPREMNEAETKHRQLAGVIDEKLESLLRYLAEEMAHVPLRNLPIKSLQAELDSFVDQSASVNALYLVTADGFIIKAGLGFTHADALHQDLENIDLSRSEIFRKVAAAKNPLWSEAFLSVVSGGLVIAYAQPLGEFYLIGEVSLDTLDKLLKRTAPKGDGLAFITDSKGGLIATSGGLQGNVRTNIGNLAIFGKLASQASVTASMTFEGVDYIGTATRLSSLGWNSLLATPKQVVFTNAYNSMKIVLAGLLVSLVLAAVSARLLLRRLSGQFEQLAAHTSDIAATGPSENRPAERIREFQQITDSLDSMATIIREREASLFDVLEYLKLDRIRFECLYELSKKEDEPEQAILDFALEAALRITESSVGYLYLLDPAEQVLTLHNWSQEVMSTGSVPSPQTTCALEETGLWGEAVRRRRAVTSNACQEEDSLATGTPLAHVRIDRYINLPVIYLGKIPLLVGVANKASLYTAEDEQHLGLLMNAAWTMIQRKKDKKLLMESDERSLQMFQQNDDAIIFFKGSPLRAVEANQAAFALFSADNHDISRLSPRRIFCRADLHKLFVAIKASQREVYINKLICRYVNGDIFFASIKANIITIDNKPVLFCSFRDISERVKLEAAMQENHAKMIQANKMTSLGLLVSSVAHEINNPNQCIGMNAFLLNRIWRDCAADLEKSHQGDESFRLDGTPFTEIKQTVPQLIDTMAESSRRIDSYIKEMLDFVRTRKDGAADTIDVNRIIKSAVSVLWYQIRSNTDHFSTQLADKNLLVHGNGQQLEQVVINMITNALQSLTTKAAAVSVESDLSADGNEVIIRFRDEGKGMDRDTLAKLTEPFFSTRQDEGGTGLGVYISANIIKEHKGTLTYDSKPGLGTTVTVGLPAAARNPEPNPALTTGGVPP